MSRAWNVDNVSNRSRGVPGNSDGRWGMYWTYVLYVGTPISERSWESICVDLGG